MYCREDWRLVAICRDGNARKHRRLGGWPVQHNAFGADIDDAATSSSTELTWLAAEASDLRVIPDNRRIDTHSYPIISDRSTGCADPRAYKGSCNEPPATPSPRRHTW